MKLINALKNTWEGLSHYGEADPANCFIRVVGTGDVVEKKSEWHGSHWARHLTQCRARWPKVAQGEVTAEVPQFTHLKRQNGLSDKSRQKLIC